MAIRDIKGEIADKIKVNTALISVFDKTNLDILITGLKKMNSSIKIISTGGTYNAIKGILGEDAKKHLIEVSEYTGFPEMEGGLVKTLHPKLHAGILGERNNKDHQQYLSGTLDNGVYIDLVVANLYPFNKVIRKDRVTFEEARGHIDIGGPAMIRAAAKNFLGCAVIVESTGYAEFIEMISQKDGCTTLEQRFKLAKNVFSLTAEYDKQIADYFKKQFFEDKIQEIY